MEVLNLWIKKIPPSQAHASEHMVPSWWHHFVDHGTPAKQGVDGGYRLLGSDLDDYRQSLLLSPLAFLICEEVALQAPITRQLLQMPCPPCHDGCASPTECWNEPHLS